MGLLDQIQSNHINMGLMEFKNSEDVTERVELREESAEVEYEIERDVLLNIMFEAVKDDVEFIFGDSIASLKEESNSVDVVFKGAISTRMISYSVVMVSIRSLENCASARRLSFRIFLKLTSLSRS